MAFTPCVDELCQPAVARSASRPQRDLHVRVRQRRVEEEDVRFDDEETSWTRVRQASKMVCGRSKKHSTRLIPQGGLPSVPGYAWGTVVGLADRLADFAYDLAPANVSRTVVRAARPLLRNSNGVSCLQSKELF